jgi:FKBP-type peptidyl-prolyl cis-trans isomerase
MMIIAAAMLIAVPVYAAEEEKPAVEPVKLENETDKISYTIGVQTGQGFKAAAFEIDLEMFVRGVQDVLAGREPALNQDEMRTVMVDLQQRMMAKMQEQSAKNLAEGTAFLKENESKPGVKVLPSGLQYKVIKEGTGRTPNATDTVKAHYRGTLLDGTEFDSSYKRNEPTEFAVNRLIPGWTEALKLMKEGSKWELFIPAKLAYGQRGMPPRIPPNSALIFEMELIEVVKKVEPAKIKAE